KGAVRIEAGATYVWTVREGIVQRVGIVRGQETETGIEIKQGLHDGDVVVVSPQANLANGGKVSVGTKGNGTMQCMHHHLKVIGKHRHIPLPCLKVLSSQAHEGCVVACAMTRRLGPIFNAANDAVAQALSTTRRAELVRGGGYISPQYSRHGHVPSQGVTTMGRLANKHILQGPVLIFG